MSKITNKKPNKARRITFRVLAAAAVIASLALTAFAAEEIFGAGDLLRSVLNTKVEEQQEFAAENQIDATVQQTISQEQVELVNEIGEVFGEDAAITSNGTTITPIAAYGDDLTYVLQIHVEAPEGTLLPDGIIYTLCDYNTKVDLLQAGEDAPYDQVGGSVDVKPMPDADPTDNEKDFQITITGYSQNPERFDDGYSKILNITGLYEHVINADGDSDGYARIVTGEFPIDITYCNPVEMVELDVDGITYGGTKTCTWTYEGEEHSESWDYSVTVRYLNISALSAEWCVDYQVSDTMHSQNLDLQIVMKDGTSPVLYLAGGMGDNGKTTTGTYLFEVPIDVDQIDYVLIGDPDVGEPQKVYLPQ